MSAIDWNDIAERCGPLIESTRRGVMKVSNLGIYALFVPNAERARVETKLAIEYIPIHGFATHMMDDGEQVFVAVVKTESVDILRAIAHGKGGK
jgi:hypothetical protein